jgi:ABC-type transport system involved in multi-copper enzyme maturation permease subunit
MKKIITGYFFRLFRSFEFWALIVLFLVASYEIVFPWIDDKNEITISLGTFTMYYGVYSTVAVDADNVHEHNFAGSGISARDLYAIYSETLPKDVFDKINYGFRWYNTEFDTITTVFGRLHAVPATVVLILIPLFLGRLFSNGTVKNLIACGHSKTQIYLASLIFSFLLNIALIFITLIFFVIVCLYYMWMPPVYLPVLLVMLLLEILICGVLSSVCIAVLFASKKEILAVIASFLLIIPMLYLVMDEYGIFDMNEAIALDYELHPYSEEEPVDYNEWKNIVMNEGIHAVTERFDIFDFDYHTYHNGKRLIAHNTAYIDPVRKFTWMTRIYMNPYVSRKMDALGLTVYEKCRCGIMAINIANNVFWIAATSALGMFIFRKREFK